MVQSNLPEPGPHSILGSGLGATSLVLLFLFAATLPLAIAAWTQESIGNFANEFGAATAILGATLLYLQFLSSGRFEWLSGRIGIDRTMGFHRIAAYALVGFAVTHPLSYIALEVFDRPSVAASLAGHAHKPTAKERSRDTRSIGRTRWICFASNEALCAI